MIKELKNVLRYPGGKSKALKHILPIVPTDFREFREPFVGGGAIYIYLKQRYPQRKFWINDLYFNLYTFWRICQKDLGAVINQVCQWKKQFSQGKELHRFLTKNIPKFNCVERASAFFIFNRVSFSGTSESGGFSEQAFRKRFTPSSIERLKELEKILSNTKITNLDYQEVIEAKGRNVFIFLDPPYYSTTKSALYGKSGNLHKAFDHHRFAEVMRKCNHKWLITYDDSSFVKKLFSFANIVSWDLTYGMRNVTKTSSQIGKELFISNYRK